MALPNVKSRKIKATRNRPISLKTFRVSTSFQMLNICSE